MKTISESEIKVKPSRILIRWYRYFEEINVNKPLVVLALGVRGAGKSAFLEALAEHYLAHGHIVLDMFGARSGEGLAWLRSPWVRELRLPTLLIKSPYVEVKCEWPTMNWNELTLSDIEKHRIIISSSPLYYDKNEEFRAVNHVMKLLFMRMGWRRYICILCRETANLFYSRLKQREDQKFAKAETIYLIREARHHGLALLMDTQKLTAVDIDLRALCDYIVFKAQGYLRIPRDLWWIFNWIKPEWLQRCHPKYFAILSRRGAVGIGLFELPKWHKRPREHLLRALNIKISKLRPEEEG